MPRGEGLAHQETESSSTWAGPPAGARWQGSVLFGNHKRFFAQRLSPERRKGAWTTAEQQRFRSSCRCLLVRDAWVRPQITPGCLTFFCLPGSKGPRPPRSAAVLSFPRPGSLEWRRYGGEGGLHHRSRRLVRGVGTGDRKVDGGGDANGEEAGRWMLRVQTFSQPHPTPGANVSGALSYHHYVWALKISTACFIIGKFSLTLSHSNWSSGKIQRPVCCMYYM